MKNEPQENGIIQFYLKGTKIFKKTTRKQRQRERNWIRGEREGEGGRDILYTYEISLEGYTTSYN